MSMIVPPPTKVGKNKKPGKCCACGQTVPAGKGNLFRGASGWLVYHATDPVTGNWLCGESMMSDLIDYASGR